MDIIELDTYPQVCFQPDAGYPVWTSSEHNFQVIDGKLSGCYHIIKNNNKVSEVSYGRNITYLGNKLKISGWTNRIIEINEQCEIELFWDSLSNEYYQININGNKVGHIKPHGGFIAWFKEVLFNLKWVSDTEYRRDVMEFDSTQLSPELALTLLAFTCCPTD